MAPTNSCARHKESFVQWRDSTSMQVGEAGLQSRRPSPTQSRRQEERRQSKNMPPQRNSNSRSSCPQSRNVSRRAMENEEQVLSQGGRRPTPQRGSEMHGVSQSRSPDYCRRSAQPPSSAMSRQIRASEGEEGGDGHPSELCDGVRPVASQVMRRCNSSTAQDEDGSTIIRNVCSNTEDAVLRIQQRRNTRIDLQTNELQRASRGSNSVSENPPQSMPLRRLSDTRSGSTAVGASPLSLHFPSSQQSERTSQSTYSNSLEQQHGLGQSERTPQSTYNNSTERQHGPGQSSGRHVIPHRHNERSPPHARGNSRQLQVQYNQPRQRGRQARREGGQSMNFEENEEIERGVLGEGEGVLPQAYSFYNNECDVDLSDSEEDGGPARYLEEPASESEDHAPEEDVDLHLTETDKRRQRRHTLSARVREGDRRVAEGLPRNYLLVDKYRKEPYGVGVGAWRKELMLLSRDLDPSIGSINHQPEEKLEKIAEWIQHTWQYSTPIRWEFVKDVIARGVSLRRAEMWKRMRLNQDKPDGMDDAIWKSLELQLNSPSMMKKIENCKHANACRVNFGRTGPLGEVGVRERLRKRLKRSPSPNEVRMEMDRPKGYAGRSKRNQEVENVMVQNGDRTWSAETGRGTPVNNPGSGTLPNDGGSHGFLPSGVLALTEDEVTQHPAFIRVMQRLEALERRGGTSSLCSDAEADNSTPLPSSTPNTAQDNDAEVIAAEPNSRAISTALGAFEEGQEEDQSQRRPSEIASAPPARRRGRPKKKAT